MQSYETKHPKCACTETLCKCPQQHPHPCFVSEDIPAEALQTLLHFCCRGNSTRPNPLALCKPLSAKKDQPDLYNKYGKDNTSSSGCRWRRDHEASSSRDKRAVEGWMTRFQIADQEKLPVDHPLMVSKLASLPSHAHLELEWRDARGIEYYDMGQRQDSGF